MAIEHDFFGLLDSGPDGALYWSESVEFGDQYVRIDLMAPDQGDVSQHALDVAAEMIRNVEGVDLDAREGMIGQLSDRTSEVTEFLLQQQEDYGEDLAAYVVEISGDLHIDMIRSLKLVNVTFLPDQVTDEEPFAIFEYTLDEDKDDDGLLVNFGIDRKVTTITSTE